jgi:hypothetical protein
MLYALKVRLLHKPFLGDRRGEKMTTPKSFLKQPPISSSHDALDHLPPKANS